MNLRKLSELIELKCIFCAYVNSVCITRETLRRAYLGALKNDLTLFNNCLDIQIEKETLEIVRKKSRRAARQLSGYSMFIRKSSREVVKRSEQKNI